MSSSRGLLSVLAACTVVLLSGCAGEVPEASWKHGRGPGGLGRPGTGGPRGPGGPGRPKEAREARESREAPEARDVPEVPACIGLASWLIARCRLIELYWSQHRADNGR